uniref:Uncharacterized protein n=1 Tax=Rhizophora mucronata TaxID=61149 RepID=A0A2P2P6P1_RHIMU
MNLQLCVVLHPHCLSSQVSLCHFCCHSFSLIVHTPRKVFMVTGSLDQFIGLFIDINRSDIRISKCNIGPL